MVYLTITTIYCLIFEHLGIGEQGVSASLVSLNQHKYDELYKINGFNGLLSDSISLNRSIPDIRHKL